MMTAESKFVLCSCQLNVYFSPFPKFEADELTKLIKPQKLLKSRPDFLSPCCRLIILLLITFPPLEVTTGQGKHHDDYGQTILRL